MRNLDGGRESALETGSAAESPHAFVDGAAPAQLAVAFPPWLLRMENEPVVS